MARKNFTRPGVLVRPILPLPSQSFLKEAHPFRRRMEIILLQVYRESTSCARLMGDSGRANSRRRNQEDPAHWDTDDGESPGGERDASGDAAVRKLRLGGYGEIDIAELVADVSDTSRYSGTIGPTSSFVTVRRGVGKMHRGSDATLRMTMSNDGGFYKFSGTHVSCLTAHGFYADVIGIYLIDTRNPYAITGVAD